MPQLHTPLRPIALLLLGLTGLAQAADVSSDADADTELSAITVTANQSSNQVGSDKINVRQADSIRDVLRDIPGVYVGGTNNMNQQLKCAAWEKAA